MNLKVDEEEYLSSFLSLNVMFFFFFFDGIVCF